MNLKRDIDSSKLYAEEFKELNLISFGSYGIVCKASKKNNNELYAVKKIPFNEQFKENVRTENMLKEIEILLKLKSDFIVKVESVWFEKNYIKPGDYETNEKSSLTSTHSVFDYHNNFLLHIQMELCLMTLKEAMNKINDELKQKLSGIMSSIGYYISSELFKEILESVDYLHKQKVIHRDLKPTNILITGGMNGRFVKLADFGIATIHEFDDHTHTKYKGTTNYRAPEVERTRKYDMKADVYSLGIIAQKVFNIDINEYFNFLKSKVTLLPEMIFQ
jgi:serine/threonine protein kinase